MKFLNELYVNPTDKKEEKYQKAETMLHIPADVQKAIMVIRVWEKTVDEKTLAGFEN